MRRFSPRRAIPLIVVACLFAQPVSAHSPAELKAWKKDWKAQNQVVMSQAMVALDAHLAAEMVGLIDEKADMERRHPCALLKKGCPKPRSDDRRYTGKLSKGVEQWRSLVEKYWRASEVNLALRVMQCESGGDPNASNGGGKVRGLFQIAYWGSRSRAAGWGEHSIYEPEANIAVGAWLRDDSGWGNWEACLP